LEYLYNITILRLIRKKIYSNQYLGKEEFQKLLEWGTKSKDFLRQINLLPTIRYGFLRSGLMSFQMDNPIFPPGLHVNLFFDYYEWFKNQRIYLDKFIRGDDF
jgi:hypothetical protein